LAADDVGAVDDEHPHATSVGDRPRQRWEHCRWAPIACSTTVRNDEEGRSR
jgi:hypothetical protein